MYVHIMNECMYITSNWSLELYLDINYKYIVVLQVSFSHLLCYCLLSRLTALIYVNINMYIAYVSY